MYCGKNGWSDDYAIFTEREVKVGSVVNGYNKQETHHEIRIPERDVTYIVLFVYSLTLIHSLNRKQSH